MEDELKKRNTDCVYFLASPLTCKKAAECEFRHSEIARLNPRDCWYWLSGNCLNPACAFRHPPLEARTHNTLEPVSLSHQASVPASKSSVPCYFYFNGFCNKGDGCSFLHGPNSVTSGQFSKAVSTVTSVHSSENRTLADKEIPPASIGSPLNKRESTANARENIQSHSEVECQPLDSNVVPQQSLSPHNSLPESDEAIIKSEILVPADYLRSPLAPSPLSADQSSEDHFDGRVEQEERWESSPGFDVLVDDGSEKLGYEDDPEYILSHGNDERVQVHDHLLHYDYEDPAGYDPLEYPELGNLYEHCNGIYGPYKHPEDDNISDHARQVTKRSRDVRLNPMIHQERHISSREVDFDDRSSTDLRNHLRKRRRITNSSKGSSLSHFHGRGRERSGRRNNWQPLQGRLSSEVVSNSVGGLSENESHMWDWPRESQHKHSRSRQQDRERRRQARPQSISSEISRGNRTSRDAQPTQEFSSTFTGPKTLAQIKEEKRNARENRDNFRGRTCNGRTTVENFEPPKPLSVILKDKRRLGSTSDDNSSSRSRHDHSEPEMHYIGLDRDNDLLEEYEKDEEDLCIEN